MCHWCIPCVVRGTSSVKHPRLTGRLIHTTAVRLALWYALIYAVALALGLAAFWWSTSRHIDEDLVASLTGELAAYTESYDDIGLANLAQTINNRQAEAQKNGRFYLLLKDRKTRLAGALQRWPRETEVETNGKVTGGWMDEDNVPPGLFDDDIFCAFIATRFADGSRLLIAQNISEAEGMEETAETLTIVAGLFGIAILMALIMSIMLGSRILKRMDTIGRTAGDIMAGDLDQRVPLSDRNDEFDALAGQLNDMLDRVQQLIKGMREVTDNVAHDLRSPLTRLRNRLEITLLEPQSEEEYREAINSGIEDADELIKTFNALLSIAQTEAGNHRAQWGRVDLCAMARDMYELYTPLAEEKNQTLTFTNGQPMEIFGSHHLLAQALSNLLENAIKYTPDGGEIKFDLRRHDRFVDVIVTDNGPGIAEADRKRVFERFVRLDSARNTQGNGLGLSLVKAVCKLHKGEIELIDADPGLVVRLRFPVAE